LPNQYGGNSIAVKLPLALSDEYGYEMLTDLKSVFKQNLKTLILTEPGERVMDPSYGVGIRKFLFENFSQSLLSNIDSKIREQARTYIPAINILQINFDTSGIDRNTINIAILYSIPGVGARDSLSVPVNTNPRF
jgi:phage baseplate assembly protein W